MGKYPPDTANEGNIFRLLKKVKIRRLEMFLDRGAIIELNINIRY